MKNFVIASSKPWHKLTFDKLTKKSNFNWYYVGSPDELNLLLNKKIKINYLFFLHWNWKVLPKIFQNYECICFHMTDLPYGRGGSPLQNLILRKKKKTMLSAFRMVDKMDAGPIYIKKALSLNGKAEVIYKRAGKLSWQIIFWIIKKMPVPKPQKNKALFFKRRNSSQSVLPRNVTMSDVYDYIRMLDAPTYPPAYINYGDFILEFSDAKLIDDIVEARVIIKKKKI